MKGLPFSATSLAPEPLPTPHCGHLLLLLGAGHSDQQGEPSLMHRAPQEGRDQVSAGTGPSSPGQLAEKAEVSAIRDQSQQTEWQVALRVEEDAFYGEV